MSEFSEIKKGKDRKVDWKKLKQSVGAGLAVVASLLSFAAIEDQISKHDQKLDNIKFRQTVTDARAKANEELNLVNVWAICTEGKQLGYFEGQDCDELSKEMQFVIINRANELSKMK